MSAASWPEGHRFPMAKYARLRARVADEGPALGIELVEPAAATRDDLERAQVTVEEREDYEPHVVAGSVVFAGVDYAAVLAAAMRVEALRAACPTASM